jgi:hypothetical protein
MKRIVLLVLIVFVVSWGGADAAPPVKQKKAKGEMGEAACFRWAFGASVKTGEGRKFVPIGSRTELQTGDRVKMFLELRERCFAYALLQKANDEMHLLFPYWLEQYNSDPVLKEVNFIPQGDAWLELDTETGTERVHLIVSKERLDQLEMLIRKAESPASTIRKELTESILSEIQRLEESRRDRRTPAEKPIEIIGRTRSIKKNWGDILSSAVEVSAKNFFSRTFTIDHRP